MRDRLIELLTTEVECNKDGHGECEMCEYKFTDKECERHISEIIADFMLEKGVIVPPCKVGDKLYYIAHRANGGKTEKYIKEETVEQISIDSRSIYAHIPRALLIDLGDLGKTVFLTREEAERALRKEDEGK